jgi:hypothetical protein
MPDDPPPGAAPGGDAPPPRRPRLRAAHLAWGLVALGVVLRCVQYASGRNLWLDEIGLAGNILTRSFAGLWQPLADGQVAPVGFLMLVKAAVVALGPSDDALRLVPLLAGLAALPVMLAVARRWLPPAGALLAIGLFALSFKHVHYSDELKQYSLDALVALLILWFAIRIEERPSRWLWGGYAVLGALAVWFSHPALFMLGGAGLVHAASALRARSGAALAGIVATGGVWLASLAACYVLVLRVPGNGEMMRTFWARAFMPLPPRSPEDLRWFVDTFFDALLSPGGFAVPGLVGIPLVLGGGVLLRTDWRRFWLLVGPALLALLASGLKRYPFEGRLLLFLVPAALLLIAAGTGALYRALRAGQGRAIAALVPLLVVALPIMTAGQDLLRPRMREETVPLFRYLAGHRRPGDLIYVYDSARLAARYYGPRYGLREGDYIQGSESRDDWTRYLDDLQRLRGHKRVWVLLSHVCTWQGVDEGRIILGYLSRVGTCVDELEEPGAALYLYDLSATRALPGWSAPAPAGAVVPGPPGQGPSSTRRSSR